VNVEASEDTGGCVWADAKECSESCLDVTTLLMIISGFEQWLRMAAENVGLQDSTLPLRSGARGS
jgi:hypothetical protein